jgi:hypothetical protein
VLSLKSLSKLEGFLLTFGGWLVIMHALYDIWYTFTWISP